MEQETLYWHFSSDPNGPWLDDNGERHVAHAASYWITPQGRNVGCPCASTEEEAWAAMGYVYDPLNDDQLNLSTNPSLL